MKSDIVFHIFKFCLLLTIIALIILVYKKYVDDNAVPKLDNIYMLCKSNNDYLSTYSEEKEQKYIRMLEAKSINFIKEIIALWRLIFNQSQLKDKFQYIKILDKIHNTNNKDEIISLLAQLQSQFQDTITTATTNDDDDVDELKNDEININTENDFDDDVQENKNTDNQENKNKADTDDPENKMDNKNKTNTEDQENFDNQENKNQTNTDNQENKNKTNDDTQNKLLENSPVSLENDMSKLSKKKVKQHQMYDQINAIYSSIPILSQQIQNILLTIKDFNAKKLNFRNAIKNIRKIQNEHNNLIIQLFNNFKVELSEEIKKYADTIISNEMFTNYDMKVDALASKIIDKLKLNLNTNMMLPTQDQIINVINERFNSLINKINKLDEFILQLSNQNNETLNDLKILLERLPESLKVVNDKSELIEQVKSLLLYLQNKRKIRLKRLQQQQQQQQEVTTATLTSEDDELSIQQLKNEIFEKLQSELSKLEINELNKLVQELNKSINERSEFLNMKINEKFTDIKNLLQSLLAENSNNNNNTTNNNNNNTNTNNNAQFEEHIQNINESKNKLNELLSQFRNTTKLTQEHYIKFQKEIENLTKQINDVALSMQNQKSSQILEQIMTEFHNIKSLLDEHVTSNTTTIVNNLKEANDNLVDAHGKITDYESKLTNIHKDFTIIKDTMNKFEESQQNLETNTQTLKAFNTNYEAYLQQMKTLQDSLFIVLHDLNNIKNTFTNEMGAYITDQHKRLFDSIKNELLIGQSYLTIKDLDNIHETIKNLSAQQAEIRETMKNANIQQMLIHETMKNANIQQIQDLDKIHKTMTKVQTQMNETMTNVSTQQNEMMNLHETMKNQQTQIHENQQTQIHETMKKQQTQLNEIMKNQQTQTHESIKTQTTMTQQTEKLHETITQQIQHYEKSLSALDAKLSNLIKTNLLQELKTLLTEKLDFEVLYSKLSQQIQSQIELVFIKEFEKLLKQHIDLQTIQNNLQKIIDESKNVPIKIDNIQTIVKTTITEVETKMLNKQNELLDQLKKILQQPQEIETKLKNLIEDQIQKLPEKLKESMLIIAAETSVTSLEIYTKDLANISETLKRTNVELEETIKAKRQKVSEIPIHKHLLEISKYQNDLNAFNIYCVQELLFETDIIVYDAIVYMFSRITLDPKLTLETLNFLAFCAIKILKSNDEYLRRKLLSVYSTYIKLIQGVDNWTELYVDIIEVIIKYIRDPDTTTAKLKINYTFNNIYNLNLLLYIKDILYAKTNFKHDIFTQIMKFKPFIHPKITYDRLLMFTKPIISDSHYGANDTGIYYLPEYKILRYFSKDYVFIVQGFEDGKLYYYNKLVNRAIVTEDASSNNNICGIISNRINGKTQMNGEFHILITKDIGIVYLKYSCDIIKPLVVQECIIMYDNTIKIHLGITTEKGETSKYDRILICYKEMMFVKGSIYIIYEPNSVSNPITNRINNTFGFPIILDKYILKLENKKLILRAKGNNQIVAQEN